MLQASEIFFFSKTYVFFFSFCFIYFFDTCYAPFSFLRSSYFFSSMKWHLGVIRHLFLCLLSSLFLIFVKFWMKEGHAFIFYVLLFIFLANVKKKKKTFLLNQADVKHNKYL
uniref:Uncharacterized protein n=1 Tax=Cacopsylla melanoneura TaxID=428564 RepID=A0A8D8SBP4_9HEMI